MKHFSSLSRLSKWKVVLFMRRHVSLCKAYNLVLTVGQHLNRSDRSKARTLRRESRKQNIPHWQHGHCQWSPQFWTAFLQTFQSFLLHYPFSFPSCNRLHFYQFSNCFWIPSPRIWFLASLYLCLVAPPFYSFLSLPQPQSWFSSVALLQCGQF